MEQGGANEVDYKVPGSHVDENDFHEAKVQTAISTTATAPRFGFRPLTHSVRLTSPAPAFSAVAAAAARCPFATGSRYWRTSTFDPLMFRS